MVSSKQIQQQIRVHFVLKCFFKLFDCLGDAVSGEGKSLMEQLRGEALKFHKPGGRGGGGLPLPIEIKWSCCRKWVLTLNLFTLQPLESIPAVVAPEAG